MKPTRTRLSQDPQFDRFLQAPVGDDRQGTSVSVLSMLVRMGTDPWQEASELAAMPEEPARQRLDDLLARFADVPALVVARTEIVSRLLACLPQGAAARQGHTAEARTATGPLLSGISIYAIIAVAFAVALLFTYLGFPQS